MYDDSGHGAGSR